VDEDGGAFRWLGGRTPPVRLLYSALGSMHGESDANPNGRITVNAEVTDCFRTADEAEVPVFLLENPLRSSNSI
jgi:hypothetical protein